MMEEWRAVPGYEGLYEVSNKGNVRNVRRNNIIKGFINTKGYIQVSLCKNGIRKNFTVHRLVALTFIPNPDNLPEINHINEDKTNNRVDNLEWCTAKYNNNYGSRKDKVRDTKIKNGYWTGLSNEEYWKDYYEKNKGKIREQHREYNEKNREKIREHNREYMREYRKKENKK